MSEPLLSVERKAELFDRFIEQMILRMNVGEIINYLCGKKESDYEAIFSQHGDEDGLESLLYDTFHGLLENGDAFPIFKEHLAAFLCKELEAESITIKWKLPEMETGEG